MMIGAGLGRGPALWRAHNQELKAGQSAFPEGRRRSLDLDGGKACVSLEYDF
jgi:hypothetical protein